MNTKSTPSSTRARGRKVPISIDGGLSPIWSPDGTELFFRNGSKPMAAAVTRKPDVSFESPVELFEGPYTLDLMGHQRWDVAPDSERFLMVESSEESASSSSKTGSKNSSA